MRLFTLALLCVGAVGFSGCATITSSEMQDVAVSAYGETGHRVDKVKCVARNDRGSWQAEAPGILSVQRSAEDLMVECKKEGQPPGFVRAISRAAAGMFGNIVFGGAVGAIIDHSKGTGYDYPSAVHVRMGSTVVVDRRDQHGTDEPIAFNEPSAREASQLEAPPGDANAPPAPAGQVKLDDLQDLLPQK